MHGITTPTTAVFKITTLNTSPVTRYVLGTRNFLSLHMCHQFHLRNQKNTRDQILPLNQCLLLFNSVQRSINSSSSLLRLDIK
jgi:hypothetical protein